MSESPPERSRTTADRTLERLLRDHDGVLRGLVWRMVLDEHAMQDVLQETYLRAVRGYSRFRRASSERTWIYRIAHNASVDYLRRRGTTPEALDGNVTSGDAHHTEAVAARIDIAAAFAQLSAAHRATAQLVIVDGVSYEECARITGVSAGTVASRVSHARAQLRVHLEGYGGEQA